MSRLLPPLCLMHSPVRASCCHRAAAPWPIRQPRFPPFIVALHLCALRSQVPALLRLCSDLLRSLPPPVLSTACFPCQFGTICSCPGRPLKLALDRLSLRSFSLTMIPPLTVAICLCDSRLIGSLCWFVCSISGNEYCFKPGQRCPMYQAWLCRVFVKRPLIASLYIQARALGPSIFLFGLCDAKSLQETATLLRLLLFHLRLMTWQHWLRPVLTCLIEPPRIACPLKTSESVIEIDFLQQQGLRVILGRWFRDCSTALHSMAAAHAHIASLM